MSDALDSVYDHIDRAPYRALLVFGSRAQAMHHFDQAPKGAIVDRYQIRMRFRSGAVVYGTIIASDQDLKKLSNIRVQCVGLATQLSEKARTIIAERCRSFGGIERRIIGGA